MDAEDWGVVAAKYGEVMWNQVKNKFKIKESEDQLPRFQAFVTYALQRLYRYWKCRLHTYYKECGTTHEERLETPPDDFPLENWRRCCATFATPEFQKRSITNTKNRSSDKWCKHTTGSLSFPEVEDILTKKNGNVKPSADVIWLAEHTHKNDKGVLEWVNDLRSKKIHMDLHQCVLDKNKEGAPQTQEQMLIKVLGHKSGYTRGKGSGYGGSVKAILHEEQQQKIRAQQGQINDLQRQLAENKQDIDEYKAEQHRRFQDMEEKFIAMLAVHRIRDVFGEDEEGH